MKNTLSRPISRSGATAATLLFAFSPVAGAWPFAFKTTGIWNSTEEPRFIPLQGDNDRRLELYGGGGLLLQPAGNSGTTTALPAFDNDPYQANSAAVGFTLGFGDAADIDGDGDLDLVRSAVLTYNGVKEDKFRMMTYLNNGSGVFTRGWHWIGENGNGLKHIGFPLKLADIDRDGDCDLIESFNGFRVRWNPGNGNFSSGATPIGPADSSCRSMVIEDFDQDGGLDIVACMSNSAGHTLRFHANSGNALFTSTVIQDGKHVENLKAADIDGDGRKDLLGYDYDARKLEYRRNTGSGFAPAVFIGPANPNTWETPAFDTGDLDEDGKLDIAISRYEGEVLWMRGDGSGGFASPLTLRSPASTNAPSTLAIADMDQDGDNDLCYDAGGNFLENLSPHREARSSVSTWGGISPSGEITLEAADITGDGRKDLIATDGGGKRILWYAGSAAGLEAPVIVSTGGAAPSSVAAADLNRDGFTDLTYVANSTIHRLYRSNGGASWSSGSVGIIAGVKKIVAGDMEGDGDTDILSLAPGSGTLTWHKNNGDGSSYPLELVDENLPAITSFTVGQETAQGRLEVCSLASGAGGFAYHHRYDNGAWNPAFGANVGIAGDSSAVAIGEVQDSTPGAEVVSALNTGVIRVQSGTGAAPGVIDYEGTVRKIALADWNQDGYIDIIAAGSTGIRLYTHARTAAWSLGSSITLSVSPSVDLAVLDIDGDRIPDLVGASTLGSLLMIRNLSHQLSIFNSPAGTSSKPLKAYPGTAADAITCTFANKGHATAPAGSSADASIAPTRIVVRFLKAVAGAGGGYTPGAAMTNSEIASVVSNISLSGSLATSTSQASGGNLTLLPTGLGQVVQTVSPGQSKSFEIRLQMTVNAANSAVTRFFVQHVSENPANGSTWSILDGSAAGDVQPAILSTVPGISSLVEVQNPSPLELWRESNFGTYFSTGSAANDNDYDKDGIANIIEFATGGDPRTADASTNQKHLLTALPFTSNPAEAWVKLSLSDAALAEPKLKVSLQYTQTLKGWTTLATRSGAAAWSGITPAASVSGGRTYHTFDTGISSSSSKKALFRLLIEELP